MRAEVAVVTRTKDRPVFLSRALASVSSQTFRDYVHVIVNDAGDPDQVKKVVARAGLADDPRIVLVDIESSQGREHASNTGIRAVDSEFVVIHDDDDSWSERFLDVAVSSMSDASRRSSTAGVVLRTDRVYEELRGGELVTLKQDRWLPHLKVVSLFEQCSVENQLTPIAFVYARWAYEEVGAYDESLDVVGDWDFGIRFLLDYDVDFIDSPEPLAFYHQRAFMAGDANNSSFAGNDSHRVTSNFLMNRYLRRELRDGRIGVGFIMGLIRHEDVRAAALIRRLRPAEVKRAVRHLLAR